MLFYLFLAICFGIMFYDSWTNDEEFQRMLKELEE